MSFSISFLPISNGSFPFPISGLARFYSHSFLFPPTPIAIQVDIFCQFIAALLLIVFWVTEILKSKTRRFFAGGLWQSSVPLSVEVPGEADLAQLWRAAALPLTANGKMWSFHSLPFPSVHSHSHEISLAIPIPMGFPRDPWEFPI